MSAMQDAANYFKMDCPKCGQSIECPIEYYEQTLPCPSCGESIVALPKKVKPTAQSSAISQLNSKLRTCQDCRGSVSNSADSCPHCGRVLKQKKSVFYYVFVGVLCLILTVGILAVAGFFGLAFLSGATSAVLNKAKERSEHVSKDLNSSTTVPTWPALTEEEKAKAVSILKNMKVEEDDIQGVKFLTHSGEPMLKTRFWTYIAQGKSSVTFRIKPLYYGDDWLFIDSYTVKAGDSVFEIKPREVDRDNSSGDVWEWSDEPAHNHKEAVSAILKNFPIKVRFNGQKYYHDHSVSGPEIGAMQDTFLVYRYLGGEW